jgi:hypothetical protein
MVLLDNFRDLQIEYLDSIEDSFECSCELASFSLLLEPLLNLSTLLDSSDHPDTCSIILRWMSDQSKNILVFLISMEAATTALASSKKIIVNNLFNSFKLIIDFIKLCQSRMSNDHFTECFKIISSWTNKNNTELVPWFNSNFNILQLVSKLIQSRYDSKSMNTELIKYYEIVLDYCSVHCPWPVNAEALETIKLLSKKRHIVFHLSSPSMKLMYDFLKGSNIKVLVN